MDPLYVAVDFDGTLVKHKYPDVGEPIPGAKETLLALQEAGHKIILYTMRSGKSLQEALQYVESLGVELFDVNKNHTQLHWTTSPKVYANIYIDDASLGCPLNYYSDERPSVNWEEVRQLLAARNIIEGGL